MKTTEVTRLELFMDVEDLRNNNQEQLEYYLNKKLLPVILTHLTTKPKGGSASISGSTSSSGETSISVHGTWAF